VLLDQLQAWLTGHIRGADRAFADYLARGGLGAAPGRTGVDGPPATA
jgi:hemerythrin